MSKVEFKTDKRHRFGKEMNLNGNYYSVDAQGITAIEPSDFESAVLAGFKRVDGKSVDKDIESNKHVIKAEEIISLANAEADRIIEDAKQEAAAIIAKAKVTAGEKIDNSLELEKQSMRKGLSEMKVDDLKNHLVVNHLPEEEWKSLTRKNEIIDYIMEKTYPSEDGE